LQEIFDVRFDFATKPSIDFDLNVFDRKTRCDACIAQMLCCGTDAGGAWVSLATAKRRSICEGHQDVS